MSFFIACDIDHTLLDDKGALLECNVAALQKARALGVTVLLATARSYAGAKPIHDALNLDTPLVVSNGTLVCAPDGGVLMAQTIEPATARKIVALFCETPHHWSFRNHDAALLHPGFDTGRAPFNDERHYRKTEPERLEALLGGYDRLITASLFGMPLRAFFYQHDWSSFKLTGDYYPPSHYNALETLSVMSATASKGNAVRWARSYLGLENAPTLCIGDSVADATMFALGTGVAPANAALEALAQADWIAPHCDRGAVAAALYRYVLAKDVPVF